MGEDASMSEDPSMGEDGSVVAAVSAVPPDSTYLFRVRENGSTSGEDSGTVDEAILTKVDGTVVGYVNRCMHFRHIRLDKGDGAPVRNGELVCSNHGAMFESATGECTHGPCEGAVLETIDIETQDGDVHLVDSDYHYVGDGPIESDPADLASTSNVEF
jgi:nitrite reductase/ring-hydroxylating ferredoxin subunit